MRMPCTPRQRRPRAGTGATSPAGAGTAPTSSASSRRRSRFTGRAEDTEERMPTARITSTTGPIDLYYEEAGQGFPLSWCHEYGGDFRSWEPQVRYFSRRYRVVTWNYRGYPPSEVVKDPDAYSVEILVDDLRGLMKHLGLRRAHVGGLSMGGGVALNFGIRHPELAESLIIAAAGAGTVGREQFLKEGEARAAMFEREGALAKQRTFAETATRKGFAEKDPRGWA